MIKSGRRPSSTAQRTVLLLILAIIVIVIGYNIFTNDNGTKTPGRACTVRAQDWSNTTSTSPPIVTVNGHMAGGFAYGYCTPDNPAYIPVG